MELEEGELMEDAAASGPLGTEATPHKSVLSLLLSDCYHMLICGTLCFTWLMVLEVYCILYMNFRVY